MAWIILVVCVVILGLANRYAVDTVDEYEFHDEDNGEGIDRAT